MNRTAAKDKDEERTGAGPGLIRVAGGMHAASAFDGPRAFMREVLLDQLTRGIERARRALRSTRGTWERHRGSAARRLQQGRHRRCRVGPQDPGDQGRVAEGEKTTSRHVRFKLHDKVGALRDLGRHLGLFPSTTDPTAGERRGPLVAMMNGITPGAFRGKAERRARLALEAGEQDDIRPAAGPAGLLASEPAASLSGCGRAFVGPQETACSARHEAAVSRERERLARAGRRPRAGRRAGPAGPRRAASRPGPRLVRRSAPAGRCSSRK